MQLNIYHYYYYYQLPFCGKNGRETVFVVGGNYRLLSPFSK